MVALEAFRLLEYGELERLSQGEALWYVYHQNLIFFMLESAINRY